ncbi:hypothetical protein CDAR_521201 [Caerostris darwini]|uniref:Uncharacterized protein n=1 Tax=Caerostris darwini TaxID=1538125 RepID=A0AAV4VA81_9ARAC|nr:hypothetical protein CDAR_521201 [Caerostris darwini]
MLFFSHVISSLGKLITVVSRAKVYQSLPPWSCSCSPIPLPFQNSLPMGIHEKHISLEKEERATPHDYLIFSRVDRSEENSATIYPERFREIENCVPRWLVDRALFREDIVGQEDLAVMGLYACCCNGLCV